MQDLKLLPPEIQDIIYKYYYSFDKYKINKFVKSAIHCNSNGWLYISYGQQDYSFYIANTFIGISDVFDNGMINNYTKDYKFIENIVLSDRSNDGHPTAN